MPPDYLMTNIASGKAPEEPQESSIVKGCVAIFANKEGNVVATYSDFTLQGYGGFTLYDSQKVRAKRALCSAVIDAYCSNAVFAALDGYDCEQIVSKMVQKTGGKMIFIAVGHPLGTEKD